MINDLVRQDVCEVPVARMCRVINLNQAQHVDEPLHPANNMCYRGGGWREEHRAFFQRHAIFRHKMFLATSFRREQAQAFIQRASDDHPKVLWIVHVRIHAVSLQPPCSVGAWSRC